MNSYNDPEEILFEVDALIAEEKIIQARDLLYDVLVDHPDYAKAHNHLGWIYHYKMTNYTKAEQHYKLALKYGKDYHSPYGNYAYFLIDKGNYEEMIAFGKQALQVHEADKGTIYNQLGKAYELTANLETAYYHYKKAIMHSTAANYIEEMQASLHRVKTKMSPFQKLKFLFK